MVFLRPVVLRDASSSNSLSLDRYDLMRGEQKAAQPERSYLMPINESPVLPPLRPPPEGMAPGVPPSLGGQRTPGPRQQRAAEPVPHDDPSRAGQQ